MKRQLEEPEMVADRQKMADAVDAVKASYLVQKFNIAYCESEVEFQMMIGNLLVCNGLRIELYYGNGEYFEKLIPSGAFESSGHLIKLLDIELCQKHKVPYGKAGGK